MAAVAAAAREVHRIRAESLPKFKGGLRALSHPRTPRHQSAQGRPRRAGSRRARRLRLHPQGRPPRPTPRPQPTSRRPPNRRPPRNRPWPALAPGKTRRLHHPRLHPAAGNLRRYETHALSLFASMPPANSRNPAASNHNHGARFARSLNVWDPGGLCFFGSLTSFTAAT